MNIPTAPLEPPRRILWPATSEDVDERRKYIEESARHWAASIVALVVDMNSHLPVTRTVDMADFVCGLADLVSDTIAEPLMRVANRLEEDETALNEPAGSTRVWGVP